MSGGARTCEAAGQCLIWTPRPFTSVWLWWQLLLHVAQLLDQSCEGDSPLRLLVPALPHQLVNLPKRKTWNGCSDQAFRSFGLGGGDCVLKKQLLTGSGQPSGWGNLLPSFSIFTKRMTVIWPWVLPIISRKHCKERGGGATLLITVSQRWLKIKGEGEDVTHWPSWGSWRSHSRWWVHTASLQKTKHLKPDRTCTESDTPARTWGRKSPSINNLGWKDFNVLQMFS